ncbi:MAG TPA: hypothetical protein VIM96_05815 [Pseudomonadales bacterium]|jgi:hypothetical protein
MKRLFYVLGSLDGAEEASFALRAAGIDKHRVHVICHDEAGIEERHLQTASWVQERDVIRIGERGALVGFLTGLAMVLVLVWWAPMNVEPGMWLLTAVLLVFTAFGAWEGGLIGWMQENYQIRPFHRALEAGCCLLTIDVPAHQCEDACNAMACLGMKRPALEDTNWISPFHRLPM